MQQQKKIIFRIKNIKPIKFRTSRVISYVSKRTPSSTLLFRLFYFVFSFFKTRPIHANKNILNSFFVAENTKIYNTASVAIFFYINYKF